MKEDADLLVVTDLTVEFAGILALKNISLTMNRDEVVAIIGSNGAGKTTFINIVTGWTAPTNGEVNFLGKSIKGFKPRVLARSGLTRSFQVSQLFRSMTVRENLMIASALDVKRKTFLASAFGTRAERERAAALSEDFGLQDELDKKVDHLSQGTKKLLDIALCSTQRPQLLFLDEPTSGVSASEKFTIMDVVMKALRKAGTTAIFVEHDMEIVQTFADRIVAFADGEIIADGSPSQVFESAEVRKHVGSHHVGDRTC